MTRADFDAKFATCVAATGAPYRAARDAIKAAGSEVNAWIAERVTSADWRVRQAAQVLQFWRQSPEVAEFVGTIAIEGGNRMAIRAPTVTGHHAPTAAATAIWSFEEDVVPRLIELVHKESNEFAPGYEDALLAIAYSADARAVPALVELLGKPDAETSHMFIIAALGEIKDPAAASAVLARATDQGASKGTRSAALVALGQMGAVEAIPTLLAAATSPTEDGMLRTSATSGLGHLGDKLSGAAVAALAALARGPDERLALNAIHSLRSAGSDAARTALAQLQQNATTPSAQSAARDATTRLA
jgi:hypothetical protein